MRVYLLSILFFLCWFSSFSQSGLGEEFAYIIRGSVKYKDTREPIQGVEVYVSGDLDKVRRLGVIPSKRGAITNSGGRYKIKAHEGSEIIFKSPHFETVRYTVLNNQDIDILVERFESSFSGRSQINSIIKKGHKIFIDSANYYKKRDIDKSIDYIEKSLTVLSDRKESQRTSLSFSTLGDIYLYWKQYDLAIDNYKRAIDARSSVATRIQMGKAYYLSEQYEESEQVFRSLSKERKLTGFQETIILEGLGDANYQLDYVPEAIESYEEALKIAQKNLISPKITDLNSKLAEANAKINNVKTAQNLFQNSLDLASKENPKRAIQEKSKVADFFNDKNQYDKEIELRKATLEDVKKLKKKTNTKNESVVSVENDTITPQKINYKIGNAFIAQDKYKEAIPYLEESIAEANKEEDLVVEKDATRKLSEVYRSVGDYGKALESYQDYVQLVDELYIKKEQEISQLTRFRRDISVKQNRITSLEKDKQLKYNLALKDQELIQSDNKRNEIIIYALIFGMLMLTLVAVLFYRTNKQQKLANNLLALKSLRSQMNPHFIFNALNSVNNFIAKSDERSANRYLSEFSTLMRSVLENSEEDFIPLEKEIQLLELYTKLEHSRFMEKFEYKIAIDEDIKISAFKIPPMLLQPYVENAIWHGLRYKEEKGLLTIHFSKINDRLIKIIIEDDGVGRKQSVKLKTENQRKQKSKGMGNIKKRIDILNDMYKDRIAVYIENMNENETGTRVVLTLKKD